MHAREIMNALDCDGFKPCVFITSDGQRHAVHDRRFVKVVTDGTVHFYQPADRDDATVKDFVRVPTDRIVAIEPLSRQSA